MMMRQLSFWAIILCGAFTAGCSRSPRANFYTLAPPPPAAERYSSARGPSVSVGRVTVPELVDRPQLVVRVGENRVAILEAQRWGEPLQSAIPRLLAADLGRLLDSSRVSWYRESSGGDAEYRVLVDVERFEAVAGDAVAVEALWTVRGTAGAQARSGRTAAREVVSGEGYDAVVAAFTRALHRVSSDIARGIRDSARASQGGM